MISRDQAGPESAMDEFSRNLKVLDELDLPAVGVDEHGIIRLWSARLGEISGYAPEAMTGSHVGCVPLAPEDEAIAPTVVATLFQQGSWAGELALINPAAERVRVTVRALLVRDGAGVVRGVLAVLSNIGKRAGGTLDEAVDGNHAVAHAEVDALATAELSHQATLDSLSAHVAVLDGSGAIIAVNAAWRRFAERAGSGDDFVGANYLGICERADDALALWIAASLRAVLAGERDEFEVEYPCHAPSQRQWFMLRARSILTPDGVRVVLMHEPITSQAIAQEETVLHRAVLDELDAAVVVTDLRHVVTDWNLGAERLYGWSREEALGTRLAALVTPDGKDAGLITSNLRDGVRAEGERLRRRKDGSVFPAYLRCRLVPDRDGGPGHFVGVAIDISERKAFEQSLVEARDYLRAVTDNMGDGLLTLDADGRVIYVNDAAAQLLRRSSSEAVGKKLAQLVGEPAAGGAERQRERAAACVKRGEVVKVTDDTFVCGDGHPLPVAYTAAPLAVAEGPSGSVIVFHDITESKAQAQRLEANVEKLAWAQRVTDALRRERFVLYAQPIIDLATHEVVQRELLIRMLPGEDSEDDRLISPAQFLPIAEEFGLIVDIDRWVVDRAAELAATSGVELNVSAHSISDPTFIDHVRDALARTGADPASLVFEITETALISNEATARRFVDQLHELGCGVSLDDFGTGWAGFTYLKHLPIDALKIDMEFVRDLRHNEASANVVNAVVGLARSFGLNTVAEGVEDEETLSLLRQLGVDHAQGYHIGRPGPVQ